MRLAPRFLAACAALALLGGTAAAGEKKADPDPKQPTLSDEEQALLDLLNAQRKKAGASPLMPEPRLSQLARGVAQGMAKDGKVTLSPEKKPLADRVREVGYVGKLSGTPATGTPPAALAAMLKNPATRATLLSASATEIGVSLATDKFRRRFWAVFVNATEEKAGKGNTKIDTGPAAEAALLQLINTERKKEGLVTLRLEEKLAITARNHSQFMAKEGKVVQNQGDKSITERARDLGFKGSAAALMSKGPPTPASVFRSWLANERAREAILNPDYQEAGIGIAAGANGTPYWTVVFGTPGSTGGE
jgi:uncharacterized protein YkwD